jgi:hypothetical protein
MKSVWPKENKSKLFRALLVIAFLLPLALLLSSCATGKPLTVKGTADIDTTGTYSVILYGHNFSNDLETVVILTKEGGPYTFDVFAPDFRYRIKKGVAAKDALEIAEKFAAFHPDFQRFRFSSILDDKGETIAYELRPLYTSLTYGFSDVLDIDYRLLKEGTVRITIRLKDSVEKQLMGDGAGGREDR